MAASRSAHRSLPRCCALCSPAFPLPSNLLELVLLPTPLSPSVFWLHSHRGAWWHSEPPGAASSLHCPLLAPLAAAVQPRVSLTARDKRTHSLLSPCPWLLGCPACSPLLGLPAAHGSPLLGTSGSTQHSPPRNPACSLVPWSCLTHPPAQQRPMRTWSWWLPSGRADSPSSLGLQHPPQRPTCAPCDVPTPGGNGL